MHKIDVAVLGAPVPIVGLGLVTVVHNTLRGAAGGAILNAELLVARALIDGSGRQNRQN